LGEGTSAEIAQENGEMTQEEQLIRRYFQTFNRHNIEGVMDCFHEHPVLVGVDASGSSAGPKFGVVTRHRLPRFLTAVANCACAPATTAVQWPSRDFLRTGGRTGAS
jgi:hypothetical protein